MTALSTNLNTIAISLNNGYSTLGTLLASRASQVSTDAALALKQDLIGQSITLWALNIIGNSDVALLQHSEGVALQAGDSTYAVFTPAGAVVRKLNVQNEIVIPDDALEITKVSGLTAALEGKASQEALTSLSTLVDGKQAAIGDALSFFDGLYLISAAAGSFSIQRLIDGAYSPIMSPSVQQWSQ